MDLTDNDRKMLRPVALEYLKPPFKYGYGYIFDAANHMVADSEDVGKFTLRVRGWGAIQYLENPEKLQDMLGELMAEALTEYWKKNT